MRENEPPAGYITDFIVAAVRVLLSVVASLFEISQNTNENGTYTTTAIPPGSVTSNVISDTSFPNVRGSPLAIARLTASLVMFSKHLS